MLLLSVTGHPAVAHVGPPFPLLIDVPGGSDRVSLWADPDIGDATFYVMLESPGGSAPKEPRRVLLWVQPVSGRLEARTYLAERQNPRHRVQFVARPEFDQGDSWNVGVRIERDGSEPVELRVVVESTPSGTGSWDLMIYSLPFALIAIGWMIAMLRLRRRSMVDLVGR